jgi:hypothetical protein
LAELWDGTRWRIRVTPYPFGAVATWLSAVSCESNTLCIAAGGYADNTGVTRTLVERWNGRTWSIETSPNPEGSSWASFNGVSCWAVDACVAVGTFEGIQVRDRVLVERWNGNRWSIQATPNLPGVKIAWLNGVACSDTSACVAVGGFIRRARAPARALAERWDGTHWTLMKPPNPTESQDTGLFDVSCAARRLCFAAGAYTDEHTYSKPLIESLLGGRWSIESLPLPRHTNDSQVAGISCATPTSCSVVGWFRRTGPIIPLAMTWTGSQWVLERAATPPDANNTFLGGLACPATDRCIAVGGYGVGQNHSRALAERRG